MENSTANKAYNYIYEGILSRKLPLGEPISEVQIGNALGISRSPVREALKQMASEGLVKQYPSKGTFVTTITLHDIEEIFELRILFEQFALRKSYEFFDSSILNHLESVMMKLNKESSTMDFYEANHLFHSTIISCCNNERAKNFYKMLSSQLTIIYAIASCVPSHDIMSKEHHLKIIQALKDKDIDLAEKLLVFHLEKTRDNTMAAYTAYSSKCNL